MSDPTHPSESTAANAASPATAANPAERYWTPARLALAAALVLGILGPTTYILWAQVDQTRQVQAGVDRETRLNRRAESLLEQFNLDNLQLERDRILSGGPPKDGIPSLTDPKTVPVKQADFLEDDARVVGVVIGDQARAYPINILNYHEAVNDKLADTPICVIYCPLCDSASVVDRQVGGNTYVFGISGLLYNSNVLLYDRTDDALWSQVYLKAVSGPNAGKSLKHLDSWAITTFERFKQRHPDGSVLTFDTGHPRNYQRNPYAGYFTNDRLMFPVQPVDERLPTKAKIIGILHNDVARAYPLDALAKAADDEGFVRDTIAGEQIAFRIEPQNDTIVIHQTPQGAQNVHTFWYAWAAFHPQTQVWGVEEGNPADNKTPTHESTE